MFSELPIQRRAGAEFFKRGAIPSGIMKPVEISEQEKVMMQHRLRELHDRNPGRIVMMPDSLIVDQLSEPKLG